jgi:Helicase conserved C-terminal domain
VFAQFTEIGEQLERYLSKAKRYKTHYLDGGTPLTKREQMIGDFQDPEAVPSVFVLSLKSDGVGITLTAANHVFHFDRWWNPTVENQATDRAFRMAMSPLNIENFPEPHSATFPVRFGGAVQKPVASPGSSASSGSPHHGSVSATA